MSSPEYVVTEKWSSTKYAVVVGSAVALCLLLLVLGYFVGNRHSVNLISENEQLLTELDNNSVSIRELEKQLIMQQQINKVDQAANAQSGQSLDQQMQTIRALERELTFYRNILAPEATDRGLQISQFIQQPISAERYSWQVSLLQAGSQGSMMSGLATVELIYLENGTEARREVLNTSGNREFGFKFRYFQHLNGEVSISDDVEPIAMEVTARQYGTNSSPITKRFDWVQIIEETIANVGQ